MTRQEIIDAFKTELNKTYAIRTTRYENGKAVDITETIYPNSLVSFNREIIEAALEELNDIQKLC